MWGQDAGRVKSKPKNLRRTRAAPPDEKRCTHKNGRVRCKNAKHGGLDVCFAHSGKAAAAAKKGGEATKAKWLEQHEALEMLPISGDNAALARFIVVEIYKITQGNHPEHVLRKWLELLHKVNLSIGGQGTVHHVVYASAQRPLPEGEEPAPLPALPDA